MIKDKKVEIFCGTGGVGKTTLSCSRAIKLASMGKKVLLITIDPSKRLKQVIGLNDEDIGQSKAVDCSLFDMNNISFDALLMSPYSTLKRFTKKFRDTEEGIGNPLLEVLGRPNGGLNEILSIVELQYQMELNKYDTIVLDTAPGSHFIDFLNTGQKITNFFDKWVKKLQNSYEN